MKSKPRKRRIWLNVILILAAVCAVAEGLLMLGVYIAGELPRPPARSDAIITLGARVMPSGELSTTLEHRVEKALELYEQGYAETVIVCGAKGSDEPMAEADAMAELLIQKGVPQERILRDPDSTNTAQNIQNAMALMGENGLNTATIVTSEYHLTRALWIARDQGLEAAGVGAPGPDLWYNRVKANFRETLSWMNYFTGGLLGRISGLAESGGE